MLAVIARARSLARSLTPLFQAAAARCFSIGDGIQDGGTTAAYTYCVENVGDAEIYLPKGRYGPTMVAHYIIFSFTASRSDSERSRTGLLDAHARLTLPCLALQLR